MDRAKAIQGIKNASPVRFIPSDYLKKGPIPGIGLCLSGGGYRAMLFHLGALLHLNDAGILGRLDRISSVSGGSIAAAYLGLRWNRLEFKGGIATRFVPMVVEPLKRLASHTLDAPCVAKGMLKPGVASRHLADSLDRLIFKGATLQDLPDEGEGPRIILNATNTLTGNLWRFSRRDMADHLLGRIPNPRIRLSQAVAASAAFPPFLSPARLPVDPKDFVRDKSSKFPEASLPSEVLLTDGGVYDNLGLEMVWKKYRTVLVSDAGNRIRYEPRQGSNFVSHTLRAVEIMQAQASSLRKRQLLEAFRRRLDGHSGAYWSITASLTDYGVKEPLPFPREESERLSQIPVRLTKLDRRTAEHLVEWGRVLCKASINRHFTRKLS